MDWRARSIQHFFVELPVGAACVYIAWGGDPRRPLYVGKTRNLVVRLAGHVRESAWVASMERLEIYSYSSESEALDAEADAIAALQPTHNSILRIPASQLAIVRRVQSRP